MKTNKYILKFKFGNEWLLVSPLYKRALKVDDETLNKLMSGELESFSENEIKILKESGILIENEKELHQLLQRMTTESSRKDVTVTFIPTWGCNFSCQYCFQTKHKKDLLGRTLSLKMVDKALEYVRLYAPKDKPIVSELTGGEPLLLSNYPIISKILKEIQNLDGMITITTNGYNLKYYAPLLLRYQDRIGMIRVTIDGPKEVHDKRRPLYGGFGTFDSIIQGIENLLDNGFNGKKLAIIIKLDKNNLAYFPEFINFIKNKGWLGKLNISVGVVGNYGNSPYSSVKEEAELLSELVALLNKHLEWMEYVGVDDEKLGMKIVRDLFIQGKIPSLMRCRGLDPLHSMTFAPDGYVYSCIEFAENHLLPTGQYYPSIRRFENNIATILNRNVFNLPNCQECSLLPICEGGCPFRDLTSNEMQALLEGKRSLNECISCKHKNLIENEYSELFFNFRKYLIQNQK